MGAFSKSCWSLIQAKSIATDVDQPIGTGSLKDCMHRCTGPVLQRNNSERQKNMSDHSTTSGVAALTICEALLLALNDAKVLPENEIMGILKLATTLNENAGGSEIEIENQKAVAALTNGIITVLSQSFHLAEEGSFVDTPMLRGQQIA
jgi:hypothetical protein